MWDRTTDGFLPGPWFKGRILADRSDVSPDGRHLIYFAVGGMGWARRATGGTWTAISALPSLTAMSIWGQGDTWGGGGMFASSSSFWLLADANTFLLRDDSSLRRETYGYHRLPIEARMERDGWVRKGDDAKRRPVFEKVIPGKWILRKVGWYRGYEIERPDASKLAFPTWEWAEWDRERLVWAEGGRLSTGEVGDHQLDSVRALYDFHPMTPPTRPKFIDAKSSQ